MAHQECQEFLAPQGPKDNKEKMELRGSLRPQQQEGKDGAENWMAISILNNDRGNV